VVYMNAVAAGYPNVGASLLARAVPQSMKGWMCRPLREQARSYKGMWCTSMLWPNIHRSQGRFATQWEQAPSPRLSALNAVSGEATGSPLLVVMAAFQPSARRAHRKAVVYMNAVAAEYPNVGASLLARAVQQSGNRLDVPASSRAGSLLQGDVVHINAVAEYP
jgi:hypothetical protein